MSSIKDKHWFGSSYVSYVFDDRLVKDLWLNRVQLELRCVTDYWNQGGACSAAVLKQGVHETIKPMNFQPLKDRSTTNYKSQPLHSRNEKAEFWRLWFGRCKRRLFPSNWNQNKFLLTVFLSARATFGSCWFQRQSKLAVHFSFTSRLLLPVSSHYSGDLSLDIANPVTPHTCFATHRRASQAVSVPSARPWYRTFVFRCFPLRYFKSFVLKIMNLSTGEVFRRDMMIQNFLREWRTPCSSPKSL